MKLECKSKDYIIEVDLDKFTQLIKREGCCIQPTLRGDLGKLDLTHVFYNVEFGNYIYISIDTENDCDILHNQVLEIIQRHLDIDSK